MIENIKHVIMVILFYFFRLCPIKQNKIVFCNFRGKGYGGNCKYIAEKILEQKNLNLDLVWLYRSERESIPDGIRAVKYASLAFVYELCTAKVWVDNCRKPGYVRKKKDQYYIMTWHGSIGLKKVEKDAEKALCNTYVSAAKRDSRMADLFLASSKFDERDYRQIFWYSGEIMRCGLPREDILYENNQNLKNQIKESIGISKDAGVVMYAPTFRVGEKDNCLSMFQIDWSRLLDAFSTRFSGQWYGIIRLHPNIAKFGDKLIKGEKVFNGTSYPDMQELMLISDCIITDYSSTITEFSKNGKPGFVFAKDMDAYAEDRGARFDFEELPFPFAQDEDQLIDNVLFFDDEKYKKDNKAFFHDRCGIYEGGHASEQVVNRIFEVIYSGKR